MKDSNSANTSFACLGILTAMGGGYLGYLWIESGSILLISGAIVALTGGVMLAAAGFNSD